MHRLLLVDGMGLLYRSFFGLKELTTKAGVPTNAIYGFIRGMNVLNAAWNPTHMAVVFDAGLPQERKRLLPEYKAQRPPMPDNLRCQVESVHRYLELAGISETSVDGCEADDVIATCATSAGNDSTFEDIYIASSDKDIYQVVCENIRMVSFTGKPGEIMDVAAVKQKTGVNPPQIVDWLALTGDSADNIPGVPGVGGKTAASLLCEFGDIEGIYAALDNMPKPRLRDNLRMARDVVFRNRMLVRLDCNLVCGCSLEDMAVDANAPDSAALNDFFREMEFFSMMTEGGQSLFSY